MSSTLKSKPAGDGGRQYVGFEEYIQHQLQQARRGIRGADILTGGVGAVLLTVAYLFLFVVTDHWLVSGGWSQPVRYVWWTGFVGLMSAWIWQRLIRPWSRRVSSLFAASQLEHSHPELQSNLLTLIDLQQAGRPVSPVIIEAMERRAALNLQQVNVDDAVDRHLLTKLSYALLAMVVVLCIYTLASPKSLMSSAWRALFPMANVTPGTRTIILGVKPGDITVFAHATPDVEVTLGGTVSGEVRVLYTTADRTLVDEPIQLQDSGEGIHRYRGRLTGVRGDGLLQNVTYRVQAGDATSPTYAVTVRQPPTATVQEVFYDYPQYMGLDDRSQPDSAIDAWEGTTVRVQALANVALDQALLLFSDTDDASGPKAEELPMEIRDGVNLSAQWQLRFRADGTFPRFYRLKLIRKSATGEEPVVVPTFHSLRIRQDLPPKLDVLHPKTDLEIPANSSVPVVYEASDPDFLLKSVTMKFEKDGVSLPKQNLLFDAPPFEQKVRGQAQVQLAALGLEPGQTLTLWLEAKDNLQPFADRLANVSRSPKVTIRVTAPVTPEQAKQQQDEQQKGADQALEAANLQDNPAGPDGESPESTAPMPPPNPDVPGDQDPKDTGTPEAPADDGADAPPATPEDGTEPTPEEQEKTDPAAEKNSEGNTTPSATKGSSPQRGNKNTSGNDATPDESTEPNPSKPENTEQGTPPKKSGSRQTSSGEKPSGTPQQEPGENKASTAGESRPKPPTTTGNGGSDRPKPRQEKAAPDEAIQKLIERQRQRQQGSKELAESTPRKPKPAAKPEEGGAESSPGDSTDTPDGQNDPASGKSKSTPNGKQPNAKKPNSPEGTPNAAESETSDPSESAKPNPPGEEKTGPGTTPRRDDKQSPGKNSNQPKKPTDQQRGALDTAPPSETPSPDAHDPASTEPAQKGGAPEKTNSPDSSEQPKSKGTPEGEGTTSPMTPDDSQTSPGTNDSEKPEEGETSPKPPEAEATPKGTATPDSKKPKPDKGAEEDAANPEPGTGDETQPGNADPEQTPDTKREGESPEKETSAQPKEKPKKESSTSPAPGMEQEPGNPADSPPRKETPPTGEKKPKGTKPDAGGTKPRSDAKSPQKQAEGQPASDPQQTDDSGSNQPSGQKPQQSPMPASPMSSSGDPGDGAAGESGSPGENGNSSSGQSTGESGEGGENPGSSGSQEGEGSNGSDSASGGGEGAPAKPDSSPSSTPQKQNGGDGAGKTPAEGSDAPPTPGTGETESPAQPQGQPAKDASGSGNTPSKNGKGKGKGASRPEQRHPADEGTEGPPMPDAGGDAQAGDTQNSDDQGGSSGGGGAGGDQSATGEEGTSPEETPMSPAEKSPDQPKQPQGGAKSQKPNPAGGNPSQNQGGNQGGGGAAGGGEPGSKSAPGRTASTGSGNSGRGAVNGGLEGGSNPEDTDVAEAPEGPGGADLGANLENQKKAANLALKTLQEELSRGETPDDLLDQLGYTEEELDTFLKQLDQHLNSVDEETTPEAEFRRKQFDELLKDIHLDSTGEMKTGGDQPRAASQSSGSNRRATPRKYESAEEAYRRGIQKGKSSK